jgi:hypothetical protein
MKITINDFKRKPLIKKPIQVDEPLPPTLVKIIDKEMLDYEEEIINLDKKNGLTKEELDYIDFIQSKYPTRNELDINRIAKINPLIKDLIERLNLKIENQITIVNTINKVI